MADPIRFGTVGSPYGTPQSGTPAAIAYARKLGFDHLEIAWVHSVRISDEGCLKIRRAAEEYDITLSVHAPYFINLNSQTPEAMAKSDARLLAAARKGYLAGATDIVFHPGSYHGQPPEQVYLRIKDKLTEIRNILDDEGVNVTLRPETMGKTAVFGTLEEVLRLSSEIPGVMPCIDYAHLHARANGGFNSYEEFAHSLELVEEALGSEGLARIHIHLSGIQYGPKGERKHLPLHEADINYRALLQALVDYDVQGVLVGEAPGEYHVKDALTFQTVYREFLAARS